MAASGNPVTRRIVALWFARLATDRLQRKKAPPCASSPEAPLVVVAKENNTLRISALDRKASSLGLSVGQPLADARAMLPDLKVMAANEPADLRLLERLADWCERFTPFVALDPPHGLLLDVTGASHLFGGEEALLGQIRVGLARQGFAVRGALAGTAVAARALAHCRDGAIAAPGEEAEAVARLPIEALDLDLGIVHALRRAGLKTVAQVAQRGRGELTIRFGAELVSTLDHALGRKEAPISPRVALPDYMAEHRFAEPVATHDIVLSTLASLAASLSEILERRGEGARSLEAMFFRADGAVRRIAVETGAPTRDANIVVRLFRERLEALADLLDPGFGFDLIRLCACRAERAETRTASFDTDLEARKEIRFLVDRLAARFGSHAILAFEPNDTHVPESAWAALPAQYARESRPGWKRLRRAGEAPRRPLRLFMKPEPVEGVCAVPDGPLLRFRWRRALHVVRFAEGPERIAMEWWRHQGAQPTRDYFRVEDEEGKRFWLYREGIPGREVPSPRWFIHGAFA